MTGEHDLPYDPTDAQSILEFAQKLVGKSLRGATGIDSIVDSTHRKGSLGNAIEEFYFGYEPNSSPLPDFNDAGIELKTTPMKRVRNGQLVSKERLVLCMIDYMKLVDETWETSSVLKKSGSILLMAYLFEPCANPVDYVFLLADLWSIPEEDLYTIKRDWETVVEKVRDGRAHEISSGDTLYLEACTKAANSQVVRPQPFSDIPAKPRAWALKKSYMTAVTQKLLNAQGISRDEHQKMLPVTELVRQHFDEYVGYTEDDLGSIFGIAKRGTRRPKNYFAMITKRILGVKDNAAILEFEKAGIKPKTIRLKRNGVPKESISFPTFDYCRLAETEFEDSKFLSYLEQKYLFVIFRQDDEHPEDYRLDGVVFWQMPEKDLPEAKRCYEEMRRRVISGHAENSVKMSENRCCHVRPHGQNSRDTNMTPYGTPVVKKCFWLNATYIGTEIKRLIEER